MSPAPRAAWGGHAPRPGGRSARPVGSCATSASTGDDEALRLDFWLGGANGARRCRLNQDYDIYVGIDWASTEHAVCVVAPDGQVREQYSVEHSGRAMGELLNRLSSMSEGQPERVAVGIEIPRGAVVEGLLERGFHVYALNPKQLDRFRDRHTVAGAKDDRLDAYVLGDSLRNDRHCYRQLRVDEPLVIELRELSRVDDDLREEANRLSNRLREQLYRYFPQMLRLSPAADEPWLWDLIEMTPTPSRARRLTTARVATVLRKNRIRRLTPGQVVSELREPALLVAQGTTQAAEAHIGLLLPRLRLVRAQRRECGQRIDRLLEQIGADDGEGETSEHRDVAILRSFPGVGRGVCATMLAEASQALQRRDYHALRAFGGVAPVTRQSGKNKRGQVVMRQACNTRLREALYHWARVGMQCDQACRTRYSALRTRGHSHGRALRGLADRQLRQLTAALRDGRLYDPSLSQRPLMASP